MYFNETLNYVNCLT